MNDSDYYARLARATDRVFKAHPSRFDHRNQYPWLTGALGDPHAGIWFVAENPCQSSPVNVPVIRGNNAPAIRGNDVPLFQGMRVGKVRMRERM